MKWIRTVADIKRAKERSEALLYDTALTLIENRARGILTAHENLDEFIMGMGAWFFTTHDDRHIGDHDSTPGYMLSFERMMDEFHRMELKVTGESMRFTANGPVVREWGATDLLDGVGVAKKYAR